MFPVSDFNFVVAGIATFAATVGYACTRRLSASLYVFSNPSSVEMSSYRYRTHRPEPNAAVLRQTLANEGESLSAQKIPTQISSDDILVDEESTSVYAPVNSEMETQRIDLPSSTFRLVRRDSLKRKVPHDGFDEPSKVYFAITLLTG